MLLQLWSELPEWIRAEAPLPIVEYINWLVSPERFTEVLQQLIPAFEAIAIAGVRTAAAFSEWGAELLRVRTEHPDWFDPTTGYLLD